MKQGDAANFAFIGPMKALRVPELPVGDWLYELKFDGDRFAWDSPKLGPSAWNFGSQSISLLRPAKLTHWQQLKKSGNSAALASYEHEVFSRRRGKTK
jgi:hypothetical protein